jgi:hypothetical protein
MMSNAIMTCHWLPRRPLVLTVITGVAMILGFPFPTAGQGICVADLLTVRSVAGKVVAELNAGEKPLPEASVTLKKGETIIAKQSVRMDGSFSFDHMRPGKYLMIVSEPGLIDFYLELEVVRSKRKRDDKEIVVIMGADFTKECNGSSAELRIKDVQRHVESSGVPVCHSLTTSPLYSWDLFLSSRPKGFPRLTSAWLTSSRCDRLRGGSLCSPTRVRSRFLER